MINDSTCAARIGPIVTKDTATRIVIWRVYIGYRTPPKELEIRNLTMEGFIVNAQQSNPYKSFKFRVKWESKYVQQRRLSRPDQFRRHHAGVRPHARQRV